MGVKSTVRSTPDGDRVKVTVKAENSEGGGGTINATVVLDITVAAGGSFTHYSSTPAHDTRVGLKYTWNDVDLPPRSSKYFEVVLDCDSGSSASAEGTVSDNASSDSDSDTAGVSCPGNPGPEQKKA